MKSRRLILLYLPPILNSLMASKIESGKFIYIEEGKKPYTIWKRCQPISISYLGGVTVRIKTRTGNTMIKLKERVFSEYEPEYNFSEVDRLLKDHLNYYIGQQRGILEEPVFN